MIAIALCTYLIYINYVPTPGGEAAPFSPPPASTPSLPSNSGISPVYSPPSSTDQVLPSGYYAKASEMYGDMPSHDIQSLYNVLMSESCKMRSYEFGTFDCSVASARLEWVLEGHGFDTYLSMGPLHAWVMVKLDGGAWVAVEATLLTSGNYCPPGIIEGAGGEYREYSYLYQMYQDYMQQYDPNLYILPTSYNDFLQNYLQPVFNPLADLDYYANTELYDSPEGAVQGTGWLYYPITEFDWWNATPYSSMEPFNEWD